MSLPENKKDALADKVSNDIVHDIQRHFKELRKNEVSQEDAIDENTKLKFKIEKLQRFSKLWKILAKGYKRELLNG